MFFRCRRTGHWTSRTSKRRHVLTRDRLFGHTDRLIDAHGTCVVDGIDDNGQPLYWDAIRKGQYDWADVLLDDARNKGAAVTFRGEDADLLSWAIENDAYESVRYILAKLTEKYASVAETSDLAEKHLHTIGKRCPKTLAHLLQNDKFTVAYARFRAPKAVFDTNSTIPTTMITDTIPDSWAAMDGEQGKGLWTEHWSEEGHILGGASDAKITVIAKLFCINRAPPRENRATTERGHLCEYLHNLNLPVDVFASETMKIYIDHWFRVYCPVYRTSIILDVVAASAFTIFSLVFGPLKEIGITRSVLSVQLMTASVNLRFLASLFCPSSQRSAICVFVLLVSEKAVCRTGIMLTEVVLIVLSVYTLVDDRCLKYCALLASLICIFQWISVSTKSLQDVDECVCSCTLVAVFLTGN